MPMRFQYDKGGKWLIEHHADAILKLAGIGPIASWRALPGEVVQSRQLPDGMVEVQLVGRPEPVLCLIEINTYPHNRMPGELLDDVLLTYLNRRVVPEAVTLVLAPQGNVRINPGIIIASPLGNARLEATWRVVNLWELNAKDLLPLSDPGIAPWVPLTRIDGPVEPVLQQCKDVIDLKSSGRERDNLLAVTEIIARLRFDATMLRSIFRRGNEMIESPLLDELFAERDVKTSQSILLRKLQRRFGSLPADVTAGIRVILDEPRLDALLDAAYAAPSLDEFRTILASTATTN